MAHSVRRLPLPASEPPFDDEVQRPPLPRASGRGRSAFTQGALALSFTTSTGLPAVPRPAALLHLVDAPPRPAATNDDAPLSNPQQWASTLAQAVLETLCGSRPPRQLLRWLDARVYRVVKRGHAAAVDSGAPGRRSGQIPAVQSVRVCRPAVGVAEACVVIRDSRRVRAMAMRLEVQAGSWLCTELDLL